MRPDVMIIGGGPAGSAAAIRLARSGRRVRLYEKARFPRAKLCGGFLSPECLPELEDLGVLSALYTSGAPLMTRSVIVSTRGTRIEDALPSPALSITRDVLDTLLLSRAAREGVDVITGEDGFAHRGEAPWTVIAAGRVHRGERSTLTGVRYVGVQALFSDVEGISNQVELDLIPSGYVGFARQSGGTTLCALTTEAEVLACGSDLDSLVKRFMTQNPEIRRHLHEAKRSSPWLTAGPVQLGIRRLTAPKTFYVGDAACVVDPFAGEGMASGIYASRLLTRALNEGGDSPERLYATLWKRAFSPALRWNAATRACYSLDVLREPVLRLLQLYPKGMTWITEMTRYRALPDPV